MKQELNAYVPEIDFTNEKSFTPLRTHREALAMIEPTDQYHLLACRPYLDNKITTLPSLWSIPTEELTFLKQALVANDRVALIADGSAVLILGELYAASGTLLAIRPQISPAALRRYAEICGMGDIRFSPAFPPSAASLSEGELEQLDELSFYLGQLLAPRGPIGPATLAWRVANFVGCRLEDCSLPTDEPRISEEQIKRLTAYLLCVFMQLHTLSGDIFATDASSPDVPQLRCRVEYVDPTDNESNEPLLQLASLRFHKLPAFSHFVLRKQGHRLILDASLPLSTKAKSLRASIPSLFVLRLTLERL